ncbi:MAG: hypothetical protein B7Z75_02115 [Acidocella sp. 20-57-95]|nr:MAG: hypothetical protein B7Z75_02115 [Acidocella sp. 20-57-95]OYV62530.1 MAG: hypothetical protein B7Z71_00950 [Acidocella sp. 21-58-7]HQT63798.1 type VI secretion system-associated FHA domain protein TagH [Acidocella sp.]HQU03202.1 type VI secretion system-associated FHA domain protein TagH [Acidocella sp.]
MTLTLSVLRCPDAVPPETKRVTGGEFRIGRGPDNDWVMPDPERMLSKRHCVIAFRNGTWAIADTSTNGTFLNREAEALGSGQIRVLNDGDRIRFGAYEIEVRLEQAQVQYAAPSAFGAPPAFGNQAFGSPTASPFDDPFGDDVFAPKQPAPETFSSVAFGTDPFLPGGMAPPPITLPNQFDALAPSTDPGFYTPPSQPDHSPAFRDAFAPPKATHQPLLPDDDWDLGFPSAPLTPPVPTPVPPPVAPQAAPFVARSAPPTMPPQPPQSVEPLNPFTEELSVAAARPVPLAGIVPPSAMPPAPPSATPSAPPPASLPVRPAAPIVPVPQAVPQTMPQAIQEAAPGADLWAAFLEGAGTHGPLPQDPAATMRKLGAAFRATVSGIRQALIARSAIKGEFRIEQTMIRSRGNNPLKFSADDDDALDALLGLGRRSDVTPDAALTDALRDMRLHELATMAAMQGAVRALLAQLDPAKLRGEADQGGLALLPAQKKARAFEAYEKLHDYVTRALADDFDSVFGKSFARAYEVALRDISAKEPS